MSNTIEIKSYDMRNDGEISKLVQCDNDEMMIGKLYCNFSDVERVVHAV